MGVLGGVFVLKSGLRILIQAPEVPFSVRPKRPKCSISGVSGGHPGKRLDRVTEGKFLDRK